MYLNARFFQALLALLVAYWAVSPYWVVHQMRRAISSGDGEALTEYIDFAALRHSLRDQINVALMDDTELNKEAGAIVMLSLIFGQEFSEEVLAGWLNPITMTQWQRAQSPNGTAPIQVAEQRYLHWNKFQLLLDVDGGEAHRYTLQRTGFFGWKLSDAVIPITQPPATDLR